MKLDELSEKQIDNFIANYQKQGKEAGGKFTLAELRLEKQRRVKSPFPPADVAKTIVRLAKQSPDGLVSYKQVWEVFRPDAIWVGNAPRTEMGKALGSVIAYCVDHRLPILSTLVVQAGKRAHSDDAIMNIHNEARNLGVDVGSDAKVFVKQQQEEALKLLADELPN